MTSCNYETDYSTVIGERILPFVFSLNTETSVLTPKPGEYQRFCYDIAGVGTDTPLYADLSHFLLGICSAITQEDILDVTVVIDGKSQNVIWGENVELKTIQHPDPPTGCTGLKFDSHWIKWMVRCRSAFLLSDLMRSAQSISVFSAAVRQLPA